jgi:hypothetical protein
MNAAMLAAAAALGKRSWRAKYRNARLPKVWVTQVDQT